jgi:uncharacterized protein YndB with AHSA1/START domain
MDLAPTGRLHGHQLILTRTFRASVEDVWASLTDSERTARWIGRWEGDAGPGKTVRLRMAHEDGQPWIDLLIEHCEPPRRLQVRTVEESGFWLLNLTLTQTGDTTELRFVHHLNDRALAGEAGPGWEYYLDMLVASREGRTLPRFKDYYPALKSYYMKGA